MILTLEPSAFVWCNAGPHIGETLHEIVDRKRADIANFGFCLWAYGGSGPGHPDKIRKLASEHSDDLDLRVLMQDSGKKSPLGVASSGYRRSKAGAVHSLPDGMSPVTGSAGSWAFYMTDLDWVTGQVDVALYSAVYTKNHTEPLGPYLRGSHGKALAARRATRNDGTAPDLRRIAVVANLSPPHSVFLA